MLAKFQAEPASTSSKKITLLGTAHIVRKALSIKWTVQYLGLAPVLQRLNKQVKDYK